MRQTGYLYLYKKVPGWTHSTVLNHRFIVEEVSLGQVQGQSFFVLTVLSFIFYPAKVNLIYSFKKQGISAFNPFQSSLPTFYYVSIAIVHPSYVFQPLISHLSPQKQPSHVQYTLAPSLYLKLGCFVLWRNFKPQKSADKPQKISWSARWQNLWMALQGDGGDFFNISKALDIRAWIAFLLVCWFIGWFFSFGRLLVKTEKGKRFIYI